MTIQAKQTRQDKQLLKPVNHIGLSRPPSSCTRLIGSTKTGELLMFTLTKAKIKQVMQQDRLNSCMDVHSTSKQERRPKHREQKWR